MKTVIRRNCFETPSSSQHSIVITKNDTHVDSSTILWCRGYEGDQSDRVYLDKEGELKLWKIDEGFGRHPFKLLTSFEDKLEYAMCEYLGSLYIDDPEWEHYYGEFENIARDVIPGFTGFDIRKKDVDIYNDQDGNHILCKDLHYGGYNADKNIYERYYLDSGGNRKPAVLDEDSYMETPDIGMIDHQSMGLLRNFLMDQNISLKEFLTNKRYVVVIDGDEYDDWGKLKASGFIDMDFIVSEYTTTDEDVRYAKWLKEYGTDY